MTGRLVFVETKPQQGTPWSKEPPKTLQNFERAVVGLPYPNASDLAMIEKMRFLDAKRTRSNEGLSGRDFYSAKCMKAVNQCIGRSIRHARDWSAIWLLDHRYAQPQIQQQISGWLRTKLRHVKEIQVGHVKREAV
eukprot:symbB.v1.2.027767.t1/scaffold2862.1/size68630/7